MEIQALLMDDEDNVVTCVRPVKAGEYVTFRKGDNYETVLAAEDIPYCHKIALEYMEKGADVIKYGELIGKTRQEIEKGHWVSDKNIYSVPRDYESEFIKIKEV